MFAVINHPCSFAVEAVLLIHQRRLQLHCEMEDITELSGLGKTISAEFVFCRSSATFSWVAFTGFGAARLVCALVGNAPNKTLAVNINVKIRLNKLEVKFWLRISHSPSIVFAPKFRLQLLARKTNGESVTSESINCEIGNRKNNFSLLPTSARTPDYASYFYV